MIYSHNKNQNRNQTWSAKTIKILNNIIFYNMQVVTKRFREIDYNRVYCNFPMTVLLWDA